LDDWGVESGGILNRRQPRERSDAFSVSSAVSCPESPQSGRRSSEVGLSLSSIRPKRFRRARAHYRTARANVKLASVRSTATGRCWSRPAASRENLPVSSSPVLSAAPSLRCRPFRTCLVENGSFSTGWRPWLNDAASSRLGPTAHRLAQFPA